MKVIVDRFEGDVAVLEWGGRQITIQKGELPSAAREGTVLTVSLEIDEAATIERRHRLQSKIEALRAKQEGAN